MGRWWCVCLGLLAWPLLAAEWTFVSEDFPPISYPQAGSAVAVDAPLAMAAGPLAELVELACQRLGHQCRVQVLPWRRALELAESGKVEGIFAVLDVPERQRYLHVSRMLLASRYSLFTPPGGTLTYRQPRDLQNARIGVYGPSGTSLVLEALFKQTEGATLEMETDNQRVLRKLLAGRYGAQGAVLMNHDVARYLQRVLGLPELRDAGTVQAIAYGIGLSRARVSEADFQAFNNVLGQLQRDGTLAEILRRHQLQAAP